MKNLAYIAVFFVLINIQTVYLKPAARIVGGENARAGQFPFAAAIYKTTPLGLYFFSGALLTNQWILTAAQAVVGATSLSIRLGSNSLSGNDSTLITLATDTVFPHPNFNESTLENDIGLVKFHLPVTYTDYIQPINYIADISLPDGSGVTTYGWGQINDSVGGVVDHLNYVNLVTLSTSECQLTYGNQITDSMLCVAGNNNEGTCNGDSGSPLIIYGSRGYTYHVGVSSFISSRGCESEDPSGFTKTAPYRDWIRDIIDNN